MAMNWSALSSFPWPVVGALVTLTLFLVGVKVQSKKLGWSVHTSSILTSKDVKGLEATLNGKRVNQLWLHEFIVQNEGWIDLTADDLSSPITISHFLSLFEPSVQGNVPAEVSLSESADKVVVELPLLKKREKLRITVLSTGSSVPEISVRAKNFRTREIRKREFDWGTTLMSGGLLLYLTSFGLSLMSGNATSSDKSKSPEMGKYRLEDMMLDVRSLGSYVRSRALLNPSYAIPIFDCDHLPGWSSSKQSILEWNGTPAVFDDIQQLHSMGVHVNTAPKAIGKNSLRLESKEELLVFRGPNNVFPYRAMTVDGVLKR